MTIITSHILDAVHGCDAVNIKIWCRRISDSGETEILKKTETDDRGRITIEVDTRHDEPEAQYELIVFTKEYFEKINLEESFSFRVSEIVLRLNLSDITEKCHAPMIISPSNCVMWWSS